MLWLCVQFPRLALEALGSDDAQLAVTDQRASQRWIVASRLALAPGTPLGTALALAPGLRALPRQLAAERAQLKSLACWAYRYSSQVTAARIEPDAAFALPQHSLWLEIGASLGLFGGLKSLLARVRTELDAQGHAFRLGVAPTLEAAALCARAGLARTLRDPRQLEARLAPLGLALLPLPAAMQAELHGAGLACLGELLALERAALARRFPASLLDYLDRLLGRAPDPRRFIRPPARFARRLELFGEVESTETLLFPLKRLFLDLQHYLRARDTGAQAFTIELAHAHAAPTRLTFELLAPGRDATHFLRLARERLERAPPAAPVLALALQAERFATPPAPQSDLFGDAQRRQGEWQQLLEKLVARLGCEAVQGIGLVADHRPEKAWAAQPMALLPAPLAGQDRDEGGSRPARAGGTYPARPANFPAARPLWLLREPRPIPAPPPLEGAAELIEAGWWDGADARRAYFTARTRGGARLWVFQDLATQQWYLHGLWA